MRLTLRTLLAYLDDVLDPTDKEELAQKIESSDFAKDLVHQTRDSVRRLRLSAPQVIGTGMGMDPNSVAEYLDNALPPEQVGDYERICLESDVHLAETAACHHVLTMVLGEPAEVEPRSRQRMYMIPAEARERRRLRAEPAHSRSALATTVAVAAAPLAAASPVVVRPQVPAANAFEVPEYLRTGSWWQSRAFLVAIAAVLLVGTAMYFVSDRMGWFRGAQDLAAAKADAQAPPKLADTAPKAEAVSPGTTPAPIESTSTIPAAPAPATTPAAGLTVAPPQLATSEIGLSPAVAGSEATAPPDSTTVSAAGTAQPTTTELIAAPAIETPAAETSPPTASASVEPAPLASTDAAPGIDPSADVSPQAAATPETPTATATPATPTLTDAPTGDAGASLAADAPAASPAAATESSSDLGEGETVPQGAPELGTYLGGKTVLLRYDPSNGGWFRVEPRSAVVAGERLLSLPEFRSQITLASGVMLDMSGGTQVVMTAGDSAAALIEMLYGRVILTNTSNADSQVRIKAGTNVGTASLERNATLAVEVKRPYVPGNDPRTTPAPAIATMFAPNGKVTWADASGEVVVDKPSRWTLVESAPAEVIADSAPPEWIDREPVVHLSEQRYGAPAIEGTLVSDRPVDIQLLELFKGRDRREVKSLVTRSSIHVGEFAPFIDALRDPEQKLPTWRTHIETLRSAMAQSPEAAEQVFKELVEQRGRPAAGDLYEMLCGYNADQIGTTAEQQKTGAIARLIDWLEEDSLDYRVLAIHDLREITGKQLMPNPSATPATRKRNVGTFRSRLESGELEPLRREE